MTDAMKKVLTEEETKRLEWEAKTFENSFSIAELREVFNKVTEAMPHWKDRIDGEMVVTEEERDYYVSAIRSAVIFFTATVPEVKVIKGSPGYGKVLIHVTALGYRDGPAGDH
jgi:hypothetical protein